MFGFAVRLMGQDDLRWLAHIAKVATGSTDFEEWDLHRKYCMHATEYYRYHRSESRGYNEDWRYAMIMNEVDSPQRRTELCDKVLKLCVEYRQASLWAIRAQCIQSLEDLEAMQHP